MKKLAKKILEARRQKAAEMVGKKHEVQLSHKALSIDEDNHRVTFVMSTANPDRHGDIVDQESIILTHFLKNPAFFLQHRSDQFPIGQWVTDSVQFEADPDNPEQKRLVGTAEFRVKYEDAARAFDHVVAGDMNMVSIGFIPHRVEYDEEKDAFVLYDCELVECSLVGIGSNRQALVKEDEKKETTEEKSETQEARDHIIAGKKALDTVIEKAEDQKEVVAHLKARAILNKAIRRIK